MDWSDHFPLFCNIRLDLNMQQNIALSDDNLETWTKYKWNPECKPSYIAKFRNNFVQFETSINDNPPDSLISVCQIL